MTTTETAIAKCRADGYSGFILESWSESEQVTLYREGTPMHGYAYTVKDGIWTRRSQSDRELTGLRAQSTAERLIRP